MENRKIKKILPTGEWKGSGRGLDTRAHFSPFLQLKK